MKCSQCYIDEIWMFLSVKLKVKAVPKCYYDNVPVLGSNVSVLI